MISSSLGFQVWESDRRPTSSASPLNVKRSGENVAVSILSGRINLYTKYWETKCEFARSRQGSGQESWETPSKHTRCVARNILGSQMCMPLKDSSFITAPKFRLEKQSSQAARVNEGCELLSPESAAESRASLRAKARKEAHSRASCAGVRCTRRNSTPLSFSFSHALRCQDTLKKR